MRETATQVFVVLLTAGMIGCSAESLVARGYVTGRTANGFIISAGSEDGIQTGDTLQIVRPFSTKKTVIAGKARVIQLVGTNSSIIKVLSGNILPGDRIEKWVRKPKEH